MQWVDPNLSDKVWHRVLGTAPPEPEPLLELIHREWSDVSAALYLALRHSGREAALLRQIAQHDQSHAKCLTGIYTLLTGKKPTVTTPAPKWSSTEAALRRCFSEKLRRSELYESHTTNPEYGFIYRLMADQERQHAHSLLELLGSQKERN